MGKRPSHGAERPGRRLSLRSRLALWMALSTTFTVVVFASAVDALARYAASASHELRTPLAVVTSELEVALRRPRDAGEWERTARASLDELRRLARLVESLLELARASGGSAGNGERFELRERLDQ